MDSKVIKKAIFSSIIIMLALCGVIVLTNLPAIKEHFRRKEVVSVQPSSTQAKENGQIGNDLSAFLRDDSFFEPEKKKTGIVITHGKKVSLMISSVASDLRIMMLDPVGQLCTGAPFQVNVEGAGTYVDEDQDGVVYLEHLRAGTYYVSLEPLDGYYVENTKTMVEVKQKLEYVALTDISYLILSEEQVDVAKEDTENREEYNTSDETEKIDKEDFVRLGAVGIDVSKYNQEIDWEKVAEDGIEFAIIRCGYRGSSSGSLIEDPMFQKNIEGAKKAGIKVGVYFFSQAITEKEAVEEASMVEELCQYTPLDLPVYLDSESAGGNGRADHLSVRERTDIIKAFCKTIENAGHNAGVYASKNWFDGKLYAEELEIYSIWLAQYTGEPSYEGSYQIWQYTSKGSVDGIPTKVDLNVRYR